VHVTVAAFAFAFGVIVFASVVQGTIGFGLALLGAPFIAIVLPEAIPVTVVLVSWPSGAFLALREHHALDRTALAWMLAGAVPGTLVGLLIIHAASTDDLAVIVGITTLLGVLGTIVSPPIRITLATASSAGFIGNVAGTAASVGGPPVALLFQHRRGPIVRATLGAYFVVSGTLSIVGYAATGEVTLDRFLLAVGLLPAMLFGVWASRHFHDLVDRGWLRPSVLVLSSIAGAAAIIRGLA
jgi:uncharacterized protein